MTRLATFGPGQLTDYGRSQIARIMYEKGKGFIGAALLVDQRDGHPSVMLHLLCQGVEIILKALLLAKDYKHYRPKLRNLGHNLVRIAAAARTATGLHIFSGAALAELRTLSDFYRQHLLRYASMFDRYIDPNTIPSRRVLRHSFAIMKYVERKALFK